MVAELWHLKVKKVINSKTVLSVLQERVVFRRFYIIGPIIVVLKRKMGKGVLILLLTQNTLCPNVRI